MNELITKPHVDIVAENFCRRCGGPLAARDNFCGECGTDCRDLITIAAARSRTSVGHWEANASSVLVNSDGLQTIKAVLNNRLAVMGIIAFIGPLGLPALWFSPRFTKKTKIITTVTYVLLTTVLPIAMAWYWLDYALRPLVDVLGR